MATMKPDRAFGCLRLRNFAGIQGADTRYGEGGTRDMVNFRPCPDGSLKTRCGYERILTFPGELRAFYSGHGETMYAVVGDKILKFSDDGSGGYTVVGTTAQKTGEAMLLSAFGALWLFDGGDLYKKQEHTFVHVEGYVPLYGVDWDPELMGEVHEEVNLLTPRVRIRYRNDLRSEVLRFDRSVARIQSVYGDESVIPMEGVTLSEDGTYCECPLFAECTEIEVLLTLDVGDLRSRITGCTRSLKYSDGQRERILMRGGADLTSVYISRAVSSGAAAESDRACATKGGEWYFPEHAGVYRFDAPILGGCRFYDRVMLFSASGAWVADLSEDHPAMIRVHGTVGCDQSDCAVLCGDVPVSYCGGRLYRWRMRSDAHNAFAAEVLSEEISEELLMMQGKKTVMRYFDSRGELWIVHPNRSGGEVRIYHMEKATFYRFRDVPMDMLLPSYGDVTFLSGGVLYTFRESLETDSGAAIRASYEGGYFDFGHPERKKHLLRAFVECDPNGGEMTMYLIGEAGGASAMTLNGGGAGIPIGIERRVSMGRFRLLRVRVETETKCRQSVYGITLTARK